LLSECPELGLTLDIGHAQLYSQKNHCVEFLELWPKRVKHVHAHDNLGGEGLEYDVHLPIGQEVIDFLSIMRAFVESEYQKTITLEVPLDHLESSVRQLKQIVDSLIV
jgi:Sugar phosphate isomerases/epimerases